MYSARCPAFYFDHCLTLTAFPVARHAYFLSFSSLLFSCPAFKLNEATFFYCLCFLFPRDLFFLLSCSHLLLLCATLLGPTSGQRVKEYSWAAKHKLPPRMPQFSFFVWRLKPCSSLSLQSAYFSASEANLKDVEVLRRLFYRFSLSAALFLPLYHRQFSGLFNVSGFLSCINLFVALLSLRFHYFFQLP